MNSDITRRELLAGAAAAVAGTALLKAAPASAVPASTTQPGTPVGVTLNPAMLGDGVSQAEALAQWTSFTGCPPLSTKVYFSHREFPTKPNAKVRACIARGMTAVLVYQPSYSPFSSADAHALERSLHALKGAGLHDAVVVLWSEGDGKHYSLTPSSYGGGYKFYSEAIRSVGWPLYTCLTGQSTRWHTYLPVGVADGDALDDYCSRHNWRQIWARGGVADLADREGKMFGWFEMGITAGRRPSDAQLKSYLVDVASYLGSRKRGTTGPIIWWSGGPENALIPASRYPQNSWIAKQWYPTMYHQLT
jgi:hypothetical protein